MRRKFHPADLHNDAIIARAVEWSAFTQAGGRIVRHFATREAARHAARLLAEHFRRPALVYAIDAMGRSAVADTVGAYTTIRSLETTMSKTFSKRFNAQRAARATVGTDAVEGTHFRTYKTFGGWAWAPVEAAAKAKPASAEHKVEPRPAAPASHPRPTGKRAAIEAAAQRGVLPDPPDFSAPTHARFRTKLARLVALAEAGDAAGLAAIAINPVSSSPKAMARYRALCLTALSTMSRRG